MNIILFHSAEVELPLSRSDNRARHLLLVLKRQPGDTFDAGIINGPCGKGTVTGITSSHLHLSFVWGSPPPPPAPIHLLIGLPRPQTARDILRDATSLGIASLHFFRSEKGEKSYAQSSLWRTDEWQDLLVAGASQAFCTWLPAVRHHASLGEAIAALPADAQGVALDNYESPGALSQYSPVHDKSIGLALGAERGWSAAERDKLRGAGFVFAHLGSRVLRTETACVAALTLLRAKFGLL